MVDEKDEKKEEEKKQNEITEDIIPVDEKEDVDSALGESVKTPEEIVKIQRRRILSDAEKIKDGAEYVVDQKGKSSLEFTDEQVEQAREEMEQDIAEKREKDLVGGMEQDLKDKFVNDARKLSDAIQKAITEKNYRNAYLLSSELTKFIKNEGEMEKLAIRKINNTKNDQLIKREINLHLNLPAKRAVAARVKKGGNEFEVWSQALDDYEDGSLAKEIKKEEAYLKKLKEEESEKKKKN